MTSQKGTMKNGVEILIVEDSPTQAAKLKFFLEQHGYQVSVANNGKEAIASMSKRKPTIAISDIIMPEMDGYELCRQIKADENLKDIPVILLTSLSDPEDIVRSLECGADNFITKPYEEKYLLSRINYIIANRELRKSEKLEIGIEILFAGQKYFINSERRQILDLLLSTYEEAVRINEGLSAKQKELARANEVLNGLYRITKEINRCTSVQEVAEKALEQTVGLPGVQAGWISLREGPSGFRTVATRHLPPALEAPGVWEEDCLCRRKLLSGGISQVTNILECERLQKAKGDTQGLHYHASVPLWIGDRMLGLMNLAGAEQGLFSDEDLKILNGVGNQISTALGRAELYEYLEREVEERTAALTAEIAERKQANEVLRETLAHLSKKNRYETIISTVTRDVHQSINLQEVLENAVESMSENIKLVEHIGIYLVEGEEAVLKAHRGLSDRYTKQAERIPYPKGATWETIIKGKPSYVADTNQDTVIGPAGREVGTKSYLSMPIRNEGKTVGCINVHSFQKNAFDEEELRLLEIVAQQIEVAINNARQAEALKQSKEEISRINEELENRVLQRTAELSAANKELESFSYSVSHDLRAPLRGIDGFSRILLEDYTDKLDEEGKRLLNLVRGKTQMMGQLIEDLLTFSRLGRQQIELTEIDMWGLAKAVFDELKANIPLQTMQFKINTLPAARGDRSMIRQVFANLLSNAIKFTRRKENAIIEVNGWVEANENLYYVKDNGVGFDMQYVNKLFGVFQRLHSVEEFEGTGLGLAIVKRIIRRHGGRVWAEGKVDESATFYFTIPYRGL